jgi:SAP domain
MTNYSDLKVVELKAELKKRGLPQTGLKQALIERLEAADNESSKLHDLPASPEAAAVEPVESHLVLNATGAATEPEVQTPDDGTPNLGAQKSGEHPVISDGAEKDADSSTMDEADCPASKSRTSSQAADTPMIDSPQTLVPSPVPEEALEVDRPDDNEATISFENHPSGPQVRDTGSKADLREGHPSPSMIKGVDSVNEESPMLPNRSDEPSIADDTRKRKRYSRSPSPSSVETTKKPKLDDITDEPNGVDVHLSTDETMPIPKVEAEPIATDPGDASTTPTTREEETLRSSAPPHSPPALKQTSPNGKDSRFKDLFPSVGGIDKDLSRVHSPANRTSDHGGDDGEEHMITPALHAATSALYIRNFMHPLHPPSLREHLTLLATPPNSSLNPEILGDFYLDPIRTHCLAVFANVAAASRVRSALHNRIWPNERTRKPLWADFVPESKVRDWIELEESTSKNGARSAGGRRWEVVYETVEGEEGYHNTQAVLREVGVGNRSQSFNGGGAHGIQGVPLGPRGSVSTGTGPRHTGAPEAATTIPKPANSGFSALDSLFKSTAAKPKLYFLPVPKELAERRLDMLADRRSRGGTRNRDGRLFNEQRRYTFEDGDLLVDVGSDLGGGWRGGGSDNYDGGGRPGGQYAPRPYLGDRRGRW